MIVTHVPLTESNARLNIGRGMGSRYGTEPIYKVAEGLGAIFRTKGDDPSGLMAMVGNSGTLKEIEKLTEILFRKNESAFGSGLINAKVFSAVADGYAMAMRCRVSKGYPEDRETVLTGVIASTKPIWPAIVTRMEGDVAKVRYIENSAVSSIPNLVASSIPLDTIRHLGKIS